MKTLLVNLFVVVLSVLTTIFVMRYADSSPLKRDKNFILTTNKGYCRLSSENADWSIEVTENDNALFVNTIVDGVYGGSINLIEDNSKKQYQITGVHLDHVNKKSFQYFEGSWEEE